MAVLEIYDGANYVPVIHIKTQSINYLPLVDRQRCGLGTMRQDVIGYKKVFTYTTNPLTLTETNAFLNILISYLFGTISFKTDRFPLTVFKGYFSASETRLYAKGSNNMQVIQFSIEEQ